MKNWLMKYFEWMYACILITCLAGYMWLMGYLIFFFYNK